MIKKKILISTSHDAHFNLALEEYLIRNEDFSDKKLLLIYINDQAIVLGKNQNIINEIRRPFLYSGQVKKARRISGGGTVIHDSGNINFAFFESHDLRWVNNYDRSVGLIADGLNKLNIGCYRNERNAILLNNGKKISGSAQYSIRNGILSHCTLLFKSDLNRMKEMLHTDSSVMISKASASVRSVTGNISDHTRLSQSELIGELISIIGFDMAYALSDSELNSVNRLKEDKYAKEEFIFDMACTGTIGNDRIKLELNKGIISSVDLPFKEKYLGKRIFSLPETDPLWEKIYP